MRVGFDVSQTGRLKAGCGYFADSLIRHLAEIDSENEYILYPTFGDVYWDPDWPTATCLINRPNFKRGLGQKTLEAAQAFWGNPPSDIEVQLGNPDLIHANNFFCPTRLRKARLVYTLYDLGFMEYPDWTTEENRIGCFRGVFNASLYADYIIAISEYSRRHFLETFPHYPADRVSVIYLASRFSSHLDFAKPASLPPLQPAHFWLTVGTLEPRKNHRGLLQAYAKLKAHLGQTFPLVLAGGQGWLMDDFERTIDNLGLRQDAVLLGYVDDRALQWLYQNCFGFVYPSLFEGFGLPVLEAMSLGAPVIASNTTSLPEIVGLSGLLVNPLQEDDIFEAMRKVSRGEVDREVLKDKALEGARSFSWEHAARQVLTLYQEVASYPRRAFA
ncbi:MAG: glycosyltransferase family 4 protein [Candidatus Tectomicrobia bacterium]|nr:glycosyltransferase family 4 protein [Candidatus Tectomicrobia bacterium]